MVQTLRTGNDVTIIGLGPVCLKSGKPFVRKVKEPEKALLMGVCPQSLEGETLTNIKKWIGQAFAPPSIAKIVVQMVNAMVNLMVNVLFIWMVHD